MLQEIISLQQSAVEKLTFEFKTNKKEITFKAPTGSGKTFMMADFMNRVIAEREDIIFLISSLSKGGLARQNYEKFIEYKGKGNFTSLNPYLINSTVSGEERLYIPTEHNVYLLPRDLYKKGGRLMQGGMSAFLDDLQLKVKTIVLIKDECHIMTNNLDNLAPSYFYKTVNFSATPKLARAQHPDVEIKNEDAQNAKLIKTIEWGNETDTVADALAKFEKIKKDYRNLLEVNPCLIIQISNKDKADEELKNIIMPALNAKPDIKWMLIVNNDKDCDTNDVFKAKKIPVAKWKDYAKANEAPIDVIIFKMVISEGWDIPRACMLYQVRDSKSKQLDEQVMGRVRRNPRLLDFEVLGEKAQQLAMTAWVWGIMPEEQKKVHGVKLHTEPQVTLDNIKIKVTKLKKLTAKQNFNIVAFLKKQEKKITHTSIFELAKQLRQADNQVRDIVYNYADDYSKWREVAEFLPELERENNLYKCDYEQSMEVKGEVSFALSSHYTDNGNYTRIGNWVWKRRDNGVRYSFDSEAEKEWADILKDISANVVMQLSLSKTNKNKSAEYENLFDIDAMGSATDEREIYLWGKNYIANSSIKFEYYLGAGRSSFPDFIMKDKFGRIHIFEVKSVNQSGEYNFDNNIYKAKVAELKKCYMQASLLTGQIFYLPVMTGSDWQITCFVKGKERTLSEEQFIDFVQTNN
jgi:type III restriction enzyme